MSFAVGWAGSDKADAPDVLDVSLDKKAYGAGEPVAVRLKPRFAGTATVTLHRSDTPNYRENLHAAAPRIWVLLRPLGDSVELAAVTVDPGEAEIFTEGPHDILEALPLPPGIAVLLASFVEQHHVERQFHKRKRDRQDTDSLGRRGRT